MATITKAYVKKKLKENGFVPHDVDSRSVYIATEYKDRIKAMEDVQRIFALDRPSIVKDRKYSSDGHIKIGNVNLVLVPERLKHVEHRRIKRHLSRTPQGGIKNEIYLEKAINQVIWDTMTALTVVFDGGGRKVVLKDVRGSKRVGGDVSDRKKADIQILTRSTKIPVSIKMDNASFWESADTYWGENAKKMLDTAEDENKLDADVRGEFMRLNKPVGTDAYRYEERDVVFGSDIVSNGFIVKKTFKSTDFKYDGESHTLHVDCTRLYKTQNDMKEEDRAWFVVRNNRNARSKNIGIHGVVVDAVPKKRVSATTQRVDRRKIK